MPEHRCLSCGRPTTNAHTCDSCEISAARRQRLNDATADELDQARALIERAESHGYVREPSIGTAYEDYLLEDADEARAYLDERRLDSDPDPDRCEACGAFDPCDCTVYLVDVDA